MDQCQEALVAEPDFCLLLIAWAYRLSKPSQAKVSMVCSQLGILDKEVVRRSFEETESYHLSNPVIQAWEQFVQPNLRLLGFVVTSCFIFIVGYTAYFVWTQPG
jgi:hypothetical protein